MSSTNVDLRLKGNVRHISSSLRNNISLRCSQFNAFHIPSMYHEYGLPPLLNPTDSSKDFNHKTIRSLSLQQKKQFHPYMVRVKTASSHIIHRGDIPFVKGRGEYSLKMTLEKIKSMVKVLGIEQEYLMSNVPD